MAIPTSTLDHLQCANMHQKLELGAAWEQDNLFSSLILSTLQKWARAFRDNEYHCAVDTNNGVEAQNKLLKYSYLPNRKNITLSSLVSHIIESFLPDRYRKYLLQKYQMTEAYRSYSAIIPEYLQTRPRSVIIHCLDRVRKANKFTNTDVRDGESEGCFNVTSQSGKVHHVDLGVTSRAPSCTCMDWIRHHIPCKHFFAIFKYYTQWSWDSLPQTYLQSPHLSCDTEALNSLDDSANSWSSQQLGECVDSPPHESTSANYTSSLPKKVRLHCLAKWQRREDMTSHRRDNQCALMAFQGQVQAKRITLWAKSRRAHRVID